MDVRGKNAAFFIFVAVALLAVFAFFELETFAGSNAQVAPLHEEPLYQAVNIVVIALRYLVMAVSTWGLSTFQQPDAVESLLAPQLWIGLGMLAVLGWRTVHCLRARRAEAAWWLFAAGGFAPVSQVFPFLHPVADRYLYFILPGLVGGALGWAGEVVAARPALRGSRAWRGAAVALAVLALVGCGARTAERAALWRLAPLVLADSAAHYPEGLTALLLEARRRAARGDADAAVRALRRANARGHTGLSQLLQDPVYQALRGHAGYEALLREMARDWIARLERLGRPTQLQLKSLARCHLVLGDRRAAIAALERGVGIGGPLTAQLEAQLAQLRAGTGRR